MNAVVLEDIAELLQREHNAIAMVDIDALAEIRRQRRDLIARLGPLAPAERPLYERVAVLWTRNERAAETALARLGGALSRAMRGRVALAGYRSSTGSQVLSRALDKEI
ncbi:MAG: hypothetical protein ABI317_04215 [Gaiellales bacterium]